MSEVRSKLMTSMLDRSLQRKNTRRRDKDTAQDFRIYRLWTEKQYGMNFVEWMEGNVEALREEFPVTKQNADNNKTWLDNAKGYLLSLV